MKGLKELLARKLITETLVFVLRTLEFMWINHSVPKAMNPQRIYNQNCDRSRGRCIRWRQPIQAVQQRQHRLRIENQTLG